MKEKILPIVEPLATGFILKKKKKRKTAFHYPL